MAAYQHLLKEKDEEIQKLQIANEALYPSSPGRDDWMKEIDVGPQDPERGEPVFGVDEDTGQTWFDFVKQLQINNPKLADHGMRINNQYVVPSGYEGIREKMDFIPGKGLQFRIDNPDGPPTYRPPTEQELKQYKHEADPMGDQASHKHLTDLLAPYQDNKGSLRGSGLSPEEIRKLMIKGLGEYRRA